MNNNELLHQAAEALELIPIEDIWGELVSHLGRTLNVDWTVAAKLLPGVDTKLETLAASRRGHLVQEFEYDLTFAFDQSAQDACVYACGAQTLVRSTWLKRVKAESFGQITLKGSLGQARGVLAIAHSEPLADTSQIESILRIYAFKASIELERELADERFYREILEMLQT